MSLTCPTPQVLVPAYCRKPAKKTKSDDEYKRLKEATDKISSIVSKQRVPLVKDKKLIKSPHRLIDFLTKHFSSALYELPLFVLWAYDKMMEKEYRRRFKDPTDRYMAIRAEYLKEKKWKSLPSVYQLIIFQLLMKRGKRNKN